MVNFRPYYLYFLDRELLSTLRLYGKVPLEAVLHDTKMCLLSTPMPSYCSLSLLFESDYANAAYIALMPLFKSGHIILNMSGARSLSTWAEEKRRQYGHSDSMRYRRYMGTEWEQVAEGSPRIHWRSVDTTADLSLSLTRYLSSGAWSEIATNKSVVVDTREVKTAIDVIVDTILGRGEKAITKELFRDAYHRYSVSEGAQRLFDFSVSVQYVSSQTREFGAILPVNGHLPIHEFDMLAGQQYVCDLYRWEVAYKQLGLYRDLLALNAEELVSFREAEPFNELLERIALALHEGSRLYSLWFLRDYCKSKRKSALARALQNAKSLIDTEWPYAQLHGERTRIMRSQPDARKVFVIHGRDLAARDSVFSVLDALGLRPIEWSQALDLVNEPNPYIGDVLDSALKEAQAIVVVLTGDDEAKLRAEFLSEDDGDHERNLTPQPRPNVIFEAGMALGQFPNRTILLSIGKIRQFSDIQGRHVLRWSNEVEARHALAERLRKAGCSVDTSGQRWLKAGPL